MNEYLLKLDKTLEEYLVKKAPALPKDLVKFLVAIAPWFAVLGAILGIPAILGAFGLGAVLTPFALIAGARSGAFWFYWVIGLAQVALAALSIKPLFAHKLTGWQYLFYSQLLGLIVSLGHYDMGNLIGTIISFYLLYQIKKSYK